MRHLLLGTTRIFFAPDDGAAGGAAGASAAAGGQPAGQPAGGAAGGAAGGSSSSAGGSASPSGGAGTGEGGGGAPPPSRPDWLEEKFWDGEKAAPRVEELAKSYRAAQAKLSTRNDDLRKQIQADMDQERLSRRPASADKYIPQAPKGLLPEGTEFKADPNNPMLKWWGNFAFEQGLSQEQYEQGIATYIEALGYGLPDRAAEVKKLGDNGQERITRAEAWAKSNLSEGAFKTLAGVAATAEGVQLVEELVRLTMGQAGAAGGASGLPAGVKTLPELQAMMKDPRYHDPYKRDPSFVKQVEDGFKAFVAAGGGRR